MANGELKGLVYVKHGRVCTRSEGPDYYLQTKDVEYLLVLNERDLWEPDYELEYYCRRICLVTGEEEPGTPKVIKVKTIEMTGDMYIHAGECNKRSAG